MKTVPKYVTAVAVKDYLEDVLPHGDPHDKNSKLLRSAIKSVHTSKPTHPYIHNTHAGIR
jgi:hypothetical protein